MKTEDTIGCAAIVVIVLSVLVGIASSALVIWLIWAAIQYLGRH